MSDKDKKVQIEVGNIIEKDMGDCSDDGLEYMDLGINVNEGALPGIDSSTVMQVSEGTVMDEEDGSLSISFAGQLLELLKYFVIMFVVIVFGEMIMAVELGGITKGTLFMFFFIPAEAMFFAMLCGIGNDKSSRIVFPIVTAIPLGFYIAQTIYYKTFGSLLSVSFLGMGNDVVGNFAWTITDVLKKSLPIIAVILIMFVAAIVVSAVNIFKLRRFGVVVHIIAIVSVVLLWICGVFGVKAFGNERMSPYNLLTNASATNDTVAKKLGVMTTGIVECGAYFWGIGMNESDEFATEEIVIPAIEKVEEASAVQEAEEEEVKESVPAIPWTNEAIDFSKLARESSDEEFKKLAGYFATRVPSTTNEHTGMFEGYNLVYICAESFWSYACNETVTPTLYKMANNGIVLNNYYNSFNNTTTNGEFAFDTSLWPDVSRYSKNGTDIGSFAQSSTKYMPQGLGDLFTAQGIPSYAFHNYYGKYYRRILSWPNLGYKCRFTGDGMYFTSNWPASDLELMEQTVDDYINDKQFHAYYMTFSGHGPYTGKNYMYNKNIGEVNALVGDMGYNDMAKGYLAGELELDRAMEYLLKRLEEAGQLDNTVIVLTSDHYPYYLEDDARDSLVGYSMDDDFDMYKSTCIIYNAGMAEPMYVDDYCCNIDIAPTILNLFNIPFDSRLMIGRDIFSNEAHKRAVLYNKSFISEYVKYNYETDETVWTVLGDKLSQEDKARYLDSMLNSIENEYMASCKAIDDNFFFTVYKLSGLMTADEIAEEESREQMARMQDDTFNIEDEEEKAAKEAERAAQEALEAAQEQERLMQEQLNMLLMQNAGEDGTVVLPVAPADGTGVAPVVPVVPAVPADDGTVAAGDMPAVGQDATVMPVQ